MVPFSFPQALHDDLLGGLRGDASRVVVYEAGLQNVAELRADLDFLGIGYRDLRSRLFHLVDDVDHCLDGYIAVVRVNLDYNVLAAGRGISLIGGGESRFDSGKQRQNAVTFARRRVESQPAVDRFSCAAFPASTATKLNSSANKKVGQAHFQAFRITSTHQPNDFSNSGHSHANLVLPGKITSVPAQADRSLFRRNPPAQQGTFFG